jgi:hypothetical protein
MAAISDIPVLQRPAFFDGQRLTADDLAAVQDYDRELRWLHNRSLHGWGVARGLTVSGERGAASIDVAPGYALDSMGRELVVAEPVSLPVPPVAAASSWYLTATYRDDADMTPELRDGACDARGAVRLPDAPAVGFRVGHRLGYDVVLARVTVAGCALKSVSTSERNELHPPSPYVGAGQTVSGATGWRAWPDDGNFYAVAATVDTTAAGFRKAPRYQASVVGERLRHDGSLVDGYAHVESAAATSFDLVVPLISGQLVAYYGGSIVELNPTGTFDATLLDELRDDLGWCVAWIGVEA